VGEVKDEPDTVAEPPAARALRAESLPLIALIARLRDSTSADPAALRRTLAAAVDRFEANARVAGVDEAGIAAASYLLCAWGDEQFDAAPWSGDGAGGAGLLQRFHDDASGGDKLMRLLTRLAEKPREHRALLELFHTCLSLGLRAGRIADHETLRARVHLALQQVAPSPALVAAWHCAPAAARPPRPPRVALPAVLLLGVLALGVYSASQLQLAARVDGVLASLQRLVPARAAVAAPQAVTAAPPRLAAALRDDIAAGRLTVRDEPLRSIVVIPVGAKAPRDADAPLARLGALLAKLPGKVVVTGYTDGSDAPTARTPSAWHQAMEWARGVADVLRPQLGDARLAVEARVDAAAAPPLRRVEIVLFPE
jgi:type VI secretion system protein ImpK